VAILSYLDPVLAIILSALILPNQMMGLWQILGTILVLGNALYSELPERK